MNKFLFADIECEILQYAKYQSIENGILVIPSGTEKILGSFAEYIKNMPIKLLRIPETVKEVEPFAFKDLYIKEIAFDKECGIDFEKFLTRDGTKRYLPYIISDGKFFNQKSFAVYETNFLYNANIKEMYICEDMSCLGNLGPLKSLKFAAVNLNKNAAFFKTTVNKKYEMIPRTYRTMVYDPLSYKFEKPYTEEIITSDFKYILWPEVIELLKDTPWGDENNKYTIPYNYNLINKTFTLDQAETIHKTMTYKKEIPELLDVGIPFKKLQNFIGERRD